MQTGQRQIASGTSHELLTNAIFADECISNLHKIYQRIHKQRGNNAATALMSAPAIFRGAPAVSASSKLPRPWHAF